MRRVILVRRLTRYRMHCSCDVVPLLATRALRRQSLSDEAGAILHDLHDSDVDDGQRVVDVVRKCSHFPPPLQLSLPTPSSPPTTADATTAHHHHHHHHYIYNYTINYCCYYNTTTAANDFTVYHQPTSLPQLQPLPPSPRPTVHLTDSTNNVFLRLRRCFRQLDRLSVSFESFATSRASSCSVSHPTTEQTPWRQRGSNTL
jgi:hypothetical protein